MDPDPQVVSTAYVTATGLAADEKIMLALFEAGIVESGFRNLDHGDRDSVGFLQQRPSQGWGTKEQCMDPAYATRKFVEKAQSLGPQNYATAGQLAQAVQRSAFPLKYDAVRAQAAALLATTRQSTGIWSMDSVSSLDTLLKAVRTVSDSGMWKRAGLIILGAILLIIGIFVVTGDGKMSSGTKKVLGLATMVATRKVKAK
jgi:hypothetical protein